MILIWSGKSPILSCNLKRCRFVTKSIHKVGERVYFPRRAPCNEVTIEDPTPTWWHQCAIMLVLYGSFYATLLQCATTAQMLLRPCAFQSDLAFQAWETLSRPSSRRAYDMELDARKAWPIRNSVLTSCPSMSIPQLVPGRTLMITSQRLCK